MVTQCGYTTAVVTEEGKEDREDMHSKLEECQGLNKGEEGSNIKEGWLNYF